MVKGNKLSPGALFSISSLLLVAGYLMKSFPLFIFAGLAPLFALTDRVQSEDRFWNLAELILIALALGFLAAHVFDNNFLVISLLEAIALSFAFMGHSFVRQRLGIGLGKLPILFFWLAIEYVLLLLPWREKAIYLGDSLTLKTDWLHWTSLVGYAGTSLWVLMVNLLVYLTLFKGDKINWVFLILTLLLIIGPIVFSYFREGRLISRMDMITLYSNKIATPGENYIRRGEVIYKVAAGISALILLAALLKNKTRA